MIIRYNRASLACRILPVLIVIGFVPALMADPPIMDPGLRTMLRFVQDPDGYSNVRSGASINALVIGKVTSGAPVFIIEPPKSGFHQVFVDRALDKRDGFVHASRLNPITKWKAFGPFQGTGVVKHSGFQAVVKSERFVASDHRITLDPNNMIQVNGKSPWGQDGGMPQYALLLEVSIHGKNIELPREAADNLYEPAIESIFLLTPGDPSRQAILVMCNSDGAGGYYVAWGFENGIYRGRAIMQP